MILREIKNIYINSISVGQHTDNDYIDLKGPLNLATHFVVDELGHTVETEQMFIYSGTAYDYSIYNAWGSGDSYTRRDYLWCTSTRNMIELAMGDDFPHMGNPAAYTSSGVRRKWYAYVRVGGSIILKVNNTTLISSSCYSSSRGGNQQNFLLGERNTSVGNMSGLVTRIYNLKYYDHNGTLVKDVVPAIYNGQYGLYCRVSNTFHTNTNVVGGSTNYHPYAGLQQIYAAS